MYWRLVLLVRKLLLAVIVVMVDGSIEMQVLLRGGDNS
jgi:hypothetical protein